MKRRAREWGVPFQGVPGLYNAITDVPGVEVGSITLIEGEGPLRPGSGPVRTGVTVILPRGKTTLPQPVWAGFYALNGNGEMTGTHWIHDAGYFVGPVGLTNTHSVGMVHHALVRWMTEHYREAFDRTHLWAMPVVAETYDGLINDILGQHVQADHVWQAIQAARSGPVAEGSVGGGTGMICYEFKGGTGTSSRIVQVGSESFTVGVLVQANHGIRDWFTVCGVPVGKHLTEDLVHTRADATGGGDTGSIIVVIGTDIPMLPHQLRRVAKRAAIGIGRNGTPGGNNSGDLFLAFSVANPMDLPQFSPCKLTVDWINDECFDPVYEAVCQCVEEAVVNAMLMAEDAVTVRPPVLPVRALHGERLM
ncbi:MAG: P1 family peptidase, partial [Alicyclobacillus sp.]|nr:P1 family peptidase [Alicyclobacillus sp.]